MSVGPVRTVRADPIGLVRRELIWTERDRADRASADHRRPEHQHRADPRPRGHARPATSPRATSPSTPCASTSPGDERRLHPLEVDGEDRHLHGAPVRADPPQPPRRRPEPRDRRLRERGGVRARGERRRQPRRPGDPRRPNRVGRRQRASPPSSPSARCLAVRPLATHVPRPPARRPRRRRRRRVGARHPGRRPRRRGRRRGHLGRVPGLRLARRRPPSCARPPPRSRSGSRWSRSCATRMPCPGCAGSPGLSVLTIGYLEDLRIALARTAAVA